MNGTVRRFGVALCTAGIFFCDCVDPAAEAPARPAGGLARPELSTVPAQQSGRIAQVVHFVLSFDATSAIPSDTLLFEGTVSTHDLHDLVAGTPSKALQARAIEATTWATSPTRIEIAPRTLLALGGRVSIAIPSASWTKTLVVVDAPAVPVLKRLWPPIESSATASYAVWCGGETVSGVTTAAPRMVELWPGPVPGRLEAGAIGEVGSACVRWTALVLSATGPLSLVPTVLLDDGREAQLDPCPLSVTSEIKPALPNACPEAATDVGCGCASVSDDRVTVLASGVSALLGVEVQGARWIGRLDDEHPMVIRPLPVSTVLPCKFSCVDNAGGQAVWERELATADPMAHVVINEVMANPAGKEPDQEWVELYNDGLVAADLEGWAFEDIGGVTLLPAHEMRPGEFALIVNESYDESGWGDRAPAPGTPLLRVKNLGKDGLSNAGEPMRLRTAQGMVVSAVPSIPSTNPSVSIARVTPDAPDGVSRSFVMWPDGGTPGAPNR